MATQRLTRDQFEGLFTRYVCRLDDGETEGAAAEAVTGGNPKLDRALIAYGRGDNSALKGLVK